MTTVRTDPHRRCQDTYVPAGLLDKLDREHTASPHSKGKTGWEFRRWSEHTPGKAYAPSWRTRGIH
eukprot:scaffold2592_cov395-Prasinococcus_capsulatus_cf.AAC.11